MKPKKIIFKEGDRVIIEPEFESEEYEKYRQLQGLVHTIKKVTDCSLYPIEIVVGGVEYILKEDEVKPFKGYNRNGANLWS